MKDLVSVIIRTQKRMRLLQRAVQSVLSQDYSDIEIVIVNDGGEAIRESSLSFGQENAELKVVNFKENKGRSAAANEGVEKSRGQFIAFLDDDDIYHKDHISSLVGAVGETDRRIAYASVQGIYYSWSHNADDFVIQAKSNLYNFDYDPSRLLFENYIPLNALLFPRMVLTEEKFDESLQINEDWNLLVRLSRKYDFVHVPKITAEYCHILAEDDSGMTSDSEARKLRHAQWLAVAFDKHKHFITGKDWKKFYTGYLIPKHEEELNMLQSRIEGMTADYEKEAGNQRIANEKRITQISSQYEDEISHVKEENEKRIETLSTAYEAELRNTIEMYDSNVKNLAAVYEREQARQKGETDKRLRQIAEGYENEIVRIREDHTKKNAQLSDGYESEIRRLIQDREKTVQNIRDEFEQAKSIIIGQYEEALSDVRTQLEEERRLRHHADHLFSLVVHSKSWKLTAPLRNVRKYGEYIAKVFRYAFSNRPEVTFRRFLLEFYHSPVTGKWLRWIPAAYKQRIKSFLLAHNERESVKIISQEPSVSIVIPVYNHADFLDQCIQSALSQDYENLEVVVADDASPDPSVKQILSKYREENRIKLIFNEENAGISETQNRAITASEGEVIAFLDCDDYLTGSAVSDAVKYWKDSTVYLHTARTNVNEKGETVQPISFEHLPRKDYFSENLEAMYATHFKLIRRDAFARVGLFDPRFDSAQDYDMLMRIAFHYPTDSFVFAPEFTYFHRLHEKQATEKYEKHQSDHTDTIQHEARLRKAISEGKFDKYISIIMLSYGKHEQTLEAVRSLADTVKIPFELILFDNGSEKETVRFLKAEIEPSFPFVRLILNDTNLGPAGGRRRALQYAKGPYYVTFDNDEIAQPGWLEELLVRGETDPEIGAVGTRVFYPDNKLQFSGGYVRQLDEELIELARYDMNKSLFDCSTSLFRNCDWLPIGATLFKVNPAPFLHIGYQNIFEDAAVSFGLRKKGYRLVNSPGSSVLHNHFMYMNQISMRKKYLNARYNPEGMLRAIASFYSENNLIIYDEYVWKENGLNSLSREDLKRKLRNIYKEIHPRIVSSEAEAN